MQVRDLEASIWEVQGFASQPGPVVLNFIPTSVSALKILPGVHKPL